MRFVETAIRVAEVNLGPKPYVAIRVINVTKFAMNTTEKILR